MKYKHIANSEQLAQKIRATLRAVHEDANPAALTEYKKLFKSTVGLTSRSNVAAYLIKQFLDGRGGRPGDRRDGRPDGRSDGRSDNRSDSRRGADRNGRDRDAREPRNGRQSERSGRDSREGRDGFRSGNGRDGSREGSREPREARENFRESSREAREAAIEAGGDQNFGLPMRTEQQQERYEKYLINITEAQSSSDEVKNFLLSLEGIGEDDLYYVRAGERDTIVHLRKSACEKLEAGIAGKQLNSVELTAKRLWSRPRRRR